MDRNGETSTFIVRVQVDRDDRVSGVVERVSTGLKERFESQEGLRRVISEMVARAMKTRPHEDGA